MSKLGFRKTALAPMGNFRPAKQGLTVSGGIMPASKTLPKKIGGK